LAAALAITVASTVHAQQAPDGASARTGQTDAVPAVALIEGFLKSGDLADAQAVAEQVLAIRPHDADVTFLLGMTLVGKGDYKRAVRLFRTLLIDHPDATRVRLELARAYFLDKDYLNANRQFQFARAGKLPPTVVANIDQFLFAIRQDKDWSYSANIALAPDSNLNAGPSSTDVTLYGLPFELSDSSRRHSGMGVAANVAGEWAPKIGPGRRLRFGMNAERRDYAGTDFDEMSTEFHAGPRFVSPRWDLSLLGTGFARWYGGNLYTHAAGGRLEATYYPGPQLGLAGSLSAQWMDYPTSPVMSGSQIAWELGATRALTASSSIMVRSAFSRQNARDPGYASWSGYVATGYFRDLAGGFSVYAQPSVAFARYDQALPVFGKVRADYDLSAQVALLNRHIVFSNFTPRIAYRFDRQTSTVPIYSHTRNSLEVGLTTSF
jgi:tetratricopeptide (TPR) repeat protein